MPLQEPAGGTNFTRDGYRGADVNDPRATIGVWTTASRQRAHRLD